MMIELVFAVFSCLAMMAYGTAELGSEVRKKTERMGTPFAGFDELFSGTERSFDGAPVSAVAAPANETVIEMAPMPFRDRYDDEYLDSLDRRTRKLALKQVDEDALSYDFTPRLFHADERMVVIRDALVDVSPGAVIATTFGSKIFKVRSDPTLVIKYQINCDALGEIHPLLRDYWFLSRLSGLGVTPQVHFVSPPTKFSLAASAKTATTMDSETRAICAADPSSTVRYMVMDRVGNAVYGYRGKLSFLDVVQVLTKTLAAIETIHENGIIHGDIHAGNVVVLDHKISSIGLIDFGKASFAKQTSRHDRFREPFQFVHHLLSPFEMEGFRPSYRDDFYRTLLLVPILMFGTPYIDYCAGLSKDDIYQLRAHGEMFSYPDGPDMLSGLDPSVTEVNKVEIRDQLAFILEVAQGMTTIERIPPYELIMEAIDNIIVLLIP